jgi:hypothetical protein
MRQKGKKRTFPRLAKTAAAVSEVRNLLPHSPVFTCQAWTPIHIKNGEKGPIVREVKAAQFFMRRDGLPTRAHWLIVARDPQRPQEIKFFVSNASAGSPLEWLLYVAYSRWPIEECFREEKSELGFDHFEVRGWQSIHRHLYLSQVSHLFVNKMREKLAAEESIRREAACARGNDFPPENRRREGARVPAREFDGGSNPLRSFTVVPSRAVQPQRQADRSSGRRRAGLLSPSSQHLREGLSYKDQATETVEIRNRYGSNPILSG